MTGLRVTALSTTPVKGFALHHPERIELTGAGAVGNRLFFLADDRRKMLSITRSGSLATWRAWFDNDTRVLTFRGGNGAVVADTVRDGDVLVADFFGDHGVTGYFVDGPWNAVFSEVVGQPVRLVRVKNPGEGCDVHPVTLLADESAATLAAHSDVHLDVRRFRMLIGFSGAGAYAEDSWRGRTVRIGGAELRVGGPVPRCAAVNRDPDTGVPDVKTLHLIHRHRGRQPTEFGDGLNLGVYATVTTPGTVAVGDALLLG